MDGKSIYTGTISDKDGNEFTVDLYKRYLDSAEATRFTYALEDDGEHIGDFEFLVNDDEEWAIADDIYLDPKYRHHHLYMIILDKARTYFQDIGLKGVMSKGRSRSEDATHTWKKIKTGEETEEIYNGHKYINYFIECEGPMKHIQVYENYRVPDNTREMMLRTAKDVAKTEGLRTDGDFIFLFHGTTRGHMESINRSGKIKMGTWFATSQEEAMKYARTKGSNPVVDTFAVYMGSLVYNGYFNLQEDVFLRDGHYAPKDYKES